MVTKRIQASVNPDYLKLQTALDRYWDLGKPSDVWTDRAQGSLKRYLDRYQPDVANQLPDWRNNEAALQRLASTLVERMEQTRKKQEVLKGYGVGEADGIAGTKTHKGYTEFRRIYENAKTPESPVLPEKFENVSPEALRAAQELVVAKAAAPQAKLTVPLTTATNITVSAKTVTPSQLLPETISATYSQSNKPPFAPNVFKAQHMLSALGKSSAALDYEKTLGQPNGRFGKSTQTVIEQFQRANNIEVTGTLDQTTWGKIRSEFTALPQGDKIKMDALNQIDRRTSDRKFSLNDISGVSRTWTGVASYYGEAGSDRFNPRDQTANGEWYPKKPMTFSNYDGPVYTAAGPTTLLGKVVKVTNDKGKSVLVRITNTGDFFENPRFGGGDRVIDLDRHAARALGMTNQDGVHTPSGTKGIKVKEVGSFYPARTPNYNWGSEQTERYMRQHMRIEFDPKLIKPRVQDESPPSTPVLAPAESPANNPPSLGQPLSSPIHINHQPNPPEQGVTLTLADLPSPPPTPAVERESESQRQVRGGEMQV